MRYKVGDKVRVRGDLEAGKSYDGITFLSEMKKGEVVSILEIQSEELYRLADKYHITYSSEMLRPASFKIWCETEEEKQAVLEELEKEGYVWCNGGEKPTEWNKIKSAPMGLIIKRGELLQKINDGMHDRNDLPELTPSEFTGLDFSEKIIITKTATGATATYGEKTVTTEGEFEDASRQALAEVLCPFKVGDRVQLKTNSNLDGEVTEISADLEVRVTGATLDAWFCFDELEPYTELYNAKLFCTKGSGTFDKGYIYEVKDGKFTDEYLIRYKLYKDLEDVNNRSVAQFMEIKGGAR